MEIARILRSLILGSPLFNSCLWPSVVLGTACPTKSVPARMIEESVLEQLRMAAANPEACQRLGVSPQAFEADPSELVRALVEEVSYDGTTGAVLLSLHPKERAHED